MSPDARIVVFDGYCRLCSGWARFMARHPITPPFRLVVMQSGEGRALLVAHGIDAEDPSTCLVLDGGQSYQDSAGVIQVIAAPGGLWRVVRLAKWVLCTGRDALYRLLARNRYRWFGRRAVCYLLELPLG